MKISKLLIMGVLVSALCMVVPATADVIPAGADTNILVGSISRPALAYHDGDVIQYSATVSVPLAGTGFGNPCRQENVDVTVTLPGGTVINFGTIAILDPGDSVTFDATDNPLMDYTIVHTDEDVNHRVTGTLHAQSEIAHVAEDDLDNATLDRDIGTTILHPGIRILKEANPTAICEGVETEITYSYQVSWAPEANGNLLNVVAVDDTCGPLVRQADNPGDNDDVLELNEVWEYECTTTISTTTTNRVDVSGEDSGGTQVTDFAEATVTANTPPEVIVDPEVAVICELNEVELCAVITPDTGTPPFSYAWTKDDVPIPDSDVECITVSEAGTYCVTVTDEAGCEAEACGTVRVIEQPDCSIDSGPTTLCDDQIDIPQEYCTLVVADNYEWEVESGPGIIPGDNLSPCVEVVPTGVGTIVLVLHVSNDVPDDGLCENSCRITILVEECGQTFCSFTQGFWGNAGGKSCDGQTTSELIAAALAANGGSIVIGRPGHSITFDSVQCILDSLPAGGTPAVLPAGDWTCATLASSGLYKNKKKTELNNVLIGQTLALQLNLLVSEGCIEDAGDLATWVLPADFCTVPYGDEEACAEYSMIPDAFVGQTVQDLLDAANDALAGIGSIGDAYSGATAINEGFDECRTVVPCIRPEICGNGCDDDGDGLVDGDDPDCQPN